MAVNIADYFNKASNGSGMPVATSLSAQKTSGAASLSVSAATNWSTATCVNLLLYTLLADGKTVTPGSVTEWKGILSGTTVGTLTLKGGTDATYPSGSVVVMAPTNSLWDDLITGLLVEHGQDGRHTLTTPKVITSINDSGGNEVIRTPATASAVNDITVTNAATGGNPTIGASGDDANADLVLQGKGTGSARFAGVHDGWVYANESWAYLSATTITVPSDATLRYSVGDKIKLTQSATVKYFYIVGVAATVLTITGGSDYTFTNTAITNNFYSKEATPLGFPQWFNFTPTVTLNGGGANNNAVITGGFSMNGRTVEAWFRYIVGSTTSFAGMTSLSFTLPVAMSVAFQLGTSGAGIGVGRASDLVNSWSVYTSPTSTTTVNPLCVIASTTYAEHASVSGAVPFAFAVNHVIQFTATYAA